MRVRALTRFACSGVTARPGWWRRSATCSTSSSPSPASRRSPSPLAKGPSLCHGTAGNAYGFLVLHRRTGDELWLDRARAFALHAIGQVERERAAVGRGRYSLFTGDIGVALFLRHLLDGEERFPTTGPFDA